MGSSPQLLFSAGLSSQKVRHRREKNAGPATYRPHQSAGTTHWQCSLPFKILPNCTRRHVAVQVALTGALLTLVSQRVGDGDKGHRATFDAKLAAVDLLQQLRNGFGAADLIAVQRTEDYQARPESQAVAGVSAQVSGAQPGCWGRRGCDGRGGVDYFALFIQRFNKRYADWVCQSSFAFA